MWYQEVNICSNKLLKNLVETMNKYLSFAVSGMLALSVNSAGEHTCNWNPIIAQLSTGIILSQTIDANSILPAVYTSGSLYKSVCKKGGMGVSFSTYSGKKDKFDFGKSLGHLQTVVTDTDPVGTTAGGTAGSGVNAGELKSHGVVVKLAGDVQKLKNAVVDKLTAPADTVAKIHSWETLFGEDITIPTLPLSSGGASVNIIPASKVADDVPTDMQKFFYEIIKTIGLLVDNKVDGLIQSGYTFSVNSGKNFCFNKEAEKRGSCRCGHGYIAASAIYVYDKFENTNQVPAFLRWIRSDFTDIGVGLEGNYTWTDRNGSITVVPTIGAWVQVWNNSKYYGFNGDLSLGTIKATLAQAYNRYLKQSLDIYGEVECKKFMPIISVKLPIFYRVTNNIDLLVEGMFNWTYRSKEKSAKAKGVSHLLGNKIQGALSIGFAYSIV